MFGAAKEITKGAEGEREKKEKKKEVDCEGTADQNFWKIGEREKERPVILMRGNYPGPV